MPAVTRSQTASDRGTNTPGQSPSGTPETTQRTRRTTSRTSEQVQPIETTPNPPRASSTSRSTPPREPPPLWEAPVPQRRRTGSASHTTVSEQEALESDLGSAQLQNARLNEEIARLRTLLSQAEESERRVEQCRAELNLELIRTNQELKTLSDTVKSKDDRLAELQASAITDKENVTRQFKAEIETLKQETRRTISTKEFEISRLEAALKDALDVQNRDEQRITELRQELQQRTVEITQIQTELSSRTEHSQLDSSRLTHEVEQLRQQHDRLLEVLRASESSRTTGLQAHQANLLTQISEATQNATAQFTSLATQVQQLSVTVAGLDSSLISNRSELTGMRHLLNDEVVGTPRKFAQVLTAIETGQQRQDALELKVQDITEKVSDLSTSLQPVIAAYATQPAGPLGEGQPEAEQHTSRQSTESIDSYIPPRTKPTPAPVQPSPHTTQQVSQSIPFVPAFDPFVNFQHTHTPPTPYPPPPPRIIVSQAPPMPNPGIHSMANPAIPQQPVSIAFSAVPQAYVSPQVNAIPTTATQSKYYATAPPQIPPQHQYPTNFTPTPQTTQPHISTHPPQQTPFQHQTPYVNPPNTAFPSQSPNAQTFNTSQAIPPPQGYQQYPQQSSNLNPPAYFPPLHQAHTAQNSTQAPTAPRLNAPAGSHYVPRRPLEGLHEAFRTSKNPNQGDLEQHFLEVTNEHPLPSYRYCSSDDPTWVHQQLEDFLYMLCQSGLTLGGGKDLPHAHKVKIPPYNRNIHIWLDNLTINFTTISITNTFLQAQIARTNLPDPAESLFRSAIRHNVLCTFTYLCQVVRRTHRTLQKIDFIAPHISIRQHPNEDIRAYNQRFTTMLTNSLAERGQADEDTTLQRDYLCIYRASLNETTHEYLRRYIQYKDSLSTKQPLRLEQFMDFAVQATPVQSLPHPPQPSNPRQSHQYSPAPVGNRSQTIQPQSQPQRITSQPQQLSQTAQPISNSQAAPSHQQPISPQRNQPSQRPPSPFRNHVCTYCNKTGHTEDRCWEKHGKPPPISPKPQQTNAMHGEPQTSSTPYFEILAEEIPYHSHTDTDTSHTLNAISIPTQRVLTFMVSLPGHDPPITALLDCGSSCNIIHPDLLAQISASPVTPSSIQIGLPNGDTLSSQGTTSILCTLGDSTLSFSFEVVPTVHPLIFGLPFLDYLDPQISWRKRSLSFKKPSGRWTTLSLNRDSQPVSIDLVSLETMTRDLQEPSTEATLFLLQSLQPSDALSSLASLPLPPEPRPDSDDLDARRAEIVATLQRKFPRVFDKPSLPPLRPGFDHEIDEIDPSRLPPKLKIYSLSPPEKQELYSQLDALLADGLIKPSKSPYNSPVLFVKKANGKLRMCIDYRVLNANTIPDAHPMPRPGDLLFELGGSTVFSKIDLVSAFWQLRVRPEDVSKTSFRSIAGQFEFLVMPFGLINSPASFQRFIDAVIKPHAAYCKGYIDDLLIHSCTFDDHLVHLDAVFQSLNDAHLHTQPEKCLFLVASTTFLGHVITPRGVCKMQSKVDAVASWKPPTTVRQLRAFLGLCGYLRKFVKDFATIAAPLHALLKENTLFLWTAKEQNAFEELRRFCCEDVILEYPDFARTFYLYTDASDTGLGASLMQHNDRQQLRPVAYYSRALTPAETRYSATEREALAILAAVRHWRHYLDGTHFIVRSNHASLQYLTSQSVLSPRQMRWVDELQAYQFSIEHISGPQNGLADALSRKFELPKLTLAAITSYAYPLSDISTIIADTHARICADPHHPGHAEALAARTKAATEGTTYTTRGSNILYRNTRTYVPPDDELRSAILSEFHNSRLGGHFGRGKTYELVCRYFYWPRLADDVTTFCKACSPCQLSKLPRHPTKALLQPLPVPTEPLQVIHLDWVTHLPITDSPEKYDTILVIIDRFSKMVRLAPTTHKYTAHDAAILLQNHWVRQFGFPAQIVCDRDPRFTGTLWRSLCTLAGSHLSLTSGYHPETNGQVERTNQTVIQALRCYLSAETPAASWHTILWAIEFAINNTVNASTRRTPFAILYGGLTMRLPIALTDAAHHNPVAATLQRQHRRIWLDVTACLSRAAKVYSNYANRLRRPLPFRVGDSVYLRTLALHPRCALNKLDQPYQGPFRVTEIINDSTCRLDLPLATGVHPVFHSTVLKAHIVDPQAPASPPDASQPITAPDRVAAIVDHRTHDNKSRRVHSFLVSWVDRPSSDNSWAWTASLRNCLALVRPYCRLHGLSAPELGIHHRPRRSLTDLAVTAPAAPSPVFAPSTSSSSSSLFEPGLPEQPSSSESPTVSTSSVHSPRTSASFSF